MFPTLFFTVAVIHVLNLLPGVSTQCLNTLAVYNPKLRTACQNGTWFIVPIDAATVQSAVGSYKLLPVPDEDTSLFPQGFPAGKHPVLVSTGYQNDIRMSALEIPALLTGQILIPLVDRLNNGKDAFAVSLKQYIGGVNGQDVQPLIPTLVGSAEGTIIMEASLDPNNQAYKDLGSNIYSSDLKEIIAPNPVSGPGIEPSAIDLLFTNTDMAMYTPHTFHDFINLPIILNNGLCQRNNYYFNQSFTEGIQRQGNVTLYSPAVSAAFAGQYNNLGGYDASAEVLGQNAETCANAAARNDPSASA